MPAGLPYRPGSDADFDRLYRDSYPRILATLRATLRDDAAAEDCAQETFVRAYRAWARWTPDAPAEAWLHRIAVNVATSHRRRELIRRPAELVRRLGRPETGSDPADVDRHALLAALRRLPPEQAAVIVLRHLHGHTHREIAAALGVPESTVGWRLAAAKARLAEHLGDAAQGPGSRGPVTGDGSRVVDDDRP